MPEAENVLEYISEFFDPEFYASSYPEVSGNFNELLRHYVEKGIELGYDPCPSFSTSFYLKANPDVAAAKINPFWHYLKHGRDEGRPGLPDITEELRALFDETYYRTANPDVVAAGIPPFEHFLSMGWREGRNPNPNFQLAYYRQAHGVPDTLNPLEHYVRFGRRQGFAGNPQQSTHGYCVQDDIRRFSNPSPKFHETRDPTIGRGKRPLAKAMALYLPQFHAFPENDAWWGKGFTEWRNVARGAPRFEGHYQPRVPEELGFYDLMQSDAMARQVEMAREAGIEGFCFYAYWFNGKRVLEKPLERFLADPSLDLSFMLMWANENWTRRWDGFETDVLLRQDYAEEDEGAMLADWARYFADPRYLRIQGRPLFILYRPGIIPEPKTTIARWRRKLKEDHGVEPWFFMTQAFGATDPRDFGLDGAMEFPPHKVAAGVAPITPSLNVTDLRFSGNVISYEEIVTRAATLTTTDYPLMRGVMPSWDNDARRQGGGTTYHGSTPELYQSWLEEAVSYARAHPFQGESIVFINAWNEWAEGAYLEPDVHFGAAYLNATARALVKKPQRTAKEKVVLFTHDAHPHGAQLLTKHIALTLTRRFGVEVAIIVLGQGPLISQYQEIAPTYVVDHDQALLDTVLDGLRDAGYQQAIVNTVVSGRAVPSLKARGFFTVSLIHELPRLIREYRMEEVARVVADMADLIVFAAEPVRQGFDEIVGGMNPDKVLLRPQGSYLPWTSDPSASAALRAEMGLAPSDKLVINVGYADARKGIDIFLSVAGAIAAERADVHFAWMGNMTSDVRNWLLSDIGPDSPLASQLHFLPFAASPVSLYEAADLFFLSSREDPFPTVVLEALKAGLPVVGLEGGGGSVDVIRQHGAVVPRGDQRAMARAITGLLDLPEQERRRASEARKDFIEQGFLFEDYVGDLLRMLRPDLGRVSVVVPNYNYAGWLPARLESIYAQTYPLHEVIVLDDASSDDSLGVLKQYRAQTGHDFALHASTQNSGSGYRQWDRGAQLAKGDFVWIAEADDLAEPDFLEAAMRLMEDEDVAFVFCDSAQRDENDAPLADSYGYYFDTVEQGALRSDFVMEGGEFIRRFLSIKNLILNVSGVLWRRSALLKALEATRAEHLTMRVACDWKMYALAAIGTGRVGYVARPLNMHRRHAQSVTHARKAEQHYAEIVSVQEQIEAMLGGLDAGILRRRSAYRAELRQAFGLSDDGRELAHKKEPVVIASVSD